MRATLALGTTLSVLAASALAAQDTVRFTPTVAQPTFAVRTPVLRVKPRPDATGPGGESGCF